MMPWQPDEATARREEWGSCVTAVLEQIAELGGGMTIVAIRDASDSA
jgi:hypothetical protein